MAHMPVRPLLHQLAGAVILVAGVVHTAAWLAICTRTKAANDVDWHRSMLNAHKILRYAAWMDVFTARPMWTGVAPLAVYMLERRFRVSPACGGQTYLKTVLVTSNAMVIYLKTPHALHAFKPGMYLVLEGRGPVDDRVASAPEDDQRDKPLPSIAIDGPIKGAPSVEHANYSRPDRGRHWRDTVRLHSQAPAARVAAAPLSGVWVRPTATPSQMRKVQFYWITKRSTTTWDGFGMLNQHYAMDSGPAPHQPNVPNTIQRAPLKLMQSFMQARQNRDIFSGLHGSKMHMRRRPGHTAQDCGSRMRSGRENDRRPGRRRGVFVRARQGSIDVSWRVLPDSTHDRVVEFRDHPDKISRK
ncbi:hypothetical protein H310_08716 [Aphanomyces invadans]|uniref:FAD-binding FR-type domain-containing protein n=1 Tax=Aphanomyces invadans TaxID=157072 RepID=A0A024TX48_9STRA|nr:hypothetical protein H310_08716 [Aphanomyces invadans]ETV98598.1 hypothetical protein H310_08716 [Aphanomyces invadans]|eukprot:XP_008872795.1 hypothetical protein H310_08716 [Aphanomyces invadans]